MKRLYVILGLALVYSLLAVSMNNRISKEKLEGRWNVKVANAPDGFQDYVVEIKEDNGEYKADILFVDSRYKISDLKFTLKDGKLTGNVNVDNERVDVTIWEEKGVVQGTAKNSYMGTMAMTFTRPKD